MADPVFVGLVQSLLASAQAVTGEQDSPMGRHLEKDGIRIRRTARRSLALLEMLQAKTLGNLDTSERALLHDALMRVRALVEPGEDGPEEARAGVALPVLDREILN